MSVIKKRGVAVVVMLMSLIPVLHVRAMSLDDGDQKYEEDIRRATVVSVMQEGITRVAEFNEAAAVAPVPTAVDIEAIKDRREALTQSERSNLDRELWKNIVAWWGMSRVVHQEDLVEKVRNILNEGADSNAIIAFDRPALAHAIKDSDSVALIDLLIDYGADANQILRCGSYTTTILGYAIDLNKKGSVDTLLKRGANPNMPCNDNGTTPLVQAVTNFKTEAQIVELLIKYGADVNAQDSDGLTALWHSTHYVGRDYGLNYSVQKKRVLILAGANVDRVRPIDQATFRGTPGRSIYWFFSEKHKVLPAMVSVLDLERLVGKDRGIAQALAERNCILVAIDGVLHNKEVTVLPSVLIDTVGDYLFPGGSDGMRVARAAREKLRHKESFFVKGLKNIKARFSSLFKR